MKKIKTKAEIIKVVMGIKGFAIKFLPTHKYTDPTQIQKNSIADYQHFSFRFFVLSWRKYFSVGLYAAITNPPSQPSVATMLPIGKMLVTKKIKSL